MISKDDIERRLRERAISAQWWGAVPDGFTALVADSREARPGVLFCAVRGTRVDGHAFLGAAAAAGAAAAVVESVDTSLGLPQLLVPDSRTALAHLASLAHSDPAGSLRLIGVTGTNGKTTTTWLSRHLLGELGPAAALGTLGLIDASGTARPGKLTTPGPIELMRALAEARASGADLVVMEVSSHALAQRRVEALAFAGAIFTNLTQDHLDYHADLRRYREAKLRLAALVEASGACVVNADDPAWGGAPFAGRRVIRYGLSPAAEVRAVDVRLDPTGSRWRLVAPEGEAAVHLPLLGEFNVYNALGAASVALSMGVRAERVAALLAAAPQVPGRLEVLAHRPATVLRDYAHTPDALARTLDAVRPATGGRLFVVFGCGGDRDRGKRPMMGRIAVEKADMAIVTSDNPRSESPADIAADIVTGLPEGSYRIVLDRREAIEAALENARPDDVVLLAGKGHERVQIFADREIPFDEAEIVAELTGEGDA
ncbi:MAG: UDP-N-acetylmuramoyl-L-alanyl-D-glutamate--2,6-diaminopimelate ligase [Gemmatimonadota bacterium]